MHQVFVSAAYRAFFNVQAAAHFRLMKATTDARGVITAITHQNAIAEMALP